MRVTEEESSGRSLARSLVRRQASQRCLTRPAAFLIIICLSRGTVLLRARASEGAPLGGEDQRTAYPREKGKKEERGGSTTTTTQQQQQRQRDKEKKTGEAER